MKIPTIHKNGTHRDTLLDGYREAYQVLSLAEVRISEAGPNARDYYPQSGQAYAVANGEHVDRLKRLQAIQKEIYDIIVGIEEQP